MKLSIESKIEVAKKELTEVEAKVRRIREAGLMESLVDALDRLESVKAGIRRLEALGAGQDELTRAVNDLSIRVDAEVVARKQQRERENELLAKLGKYMDNWL